MTHTPGPWTVRPSHTGETLVLIPGYAPQKLRINRPDVSLISAAPELLEACKALADNWGNDPDVVAHIRALRVAIAKAEGRAE